RPRTSPPRADSCLARLGCQAGPCPRQGRARPSLIYRPFQVPTPSPSRKGDLLMPSHTRPRHARKEIRDFADWLDDHGWRFEDFDSDGHSLWSYPGVSERFKLPETPKRFHVQTNRARVLRLMGHDVKGKRKPKDYSAPKAAPQQALTGNQLKRTVDVIESVCRQLRQGVTRDGQPPEWARVIAQTEAHII